MKKLKLTKLAENEIEKDQLNDVKGGTAAWPFCWIPCDCTNAEHLRSADRQIERSR